MRIQITMDLGILNNLFQSLRLRSLTSPPLLFWRQPQMKKMLKILATKKNKGILESRTAKWSKRAILAAQKKAKCANAKDKLPTLLTTTTITLFSPISITAYHNFTNLSMVKSPAQMMLLEIHNQEKQSIASVIILHMSKISA